MTAFDIVLTFFIEIYNTLNRIPIPGFEDVSMFGFSVAVIIMTVVVSGIVNVVSHSSFSFRFSREKSKNETKSKSNKGDIK